MRRAVRLAGVALLGLLTWQAIVTLAELPRFILPAPHLVFATLWTSRTLIAATHLELHDRIVNDPKRPGRRS